MTFTIAITAYFILSIAVVISLRIQLHNARKLTWKLQMQHQKLLMQNYAEDIDQQAYAQCRYSSEDK